MLAGLNPDSPVWTVALTCFVIGLGLGWVASPTLIAAQSSVDWAERGVVTGSNMFARSMGSALGIAVFGAIVNGSLGHSVGGHVSSTASGIPLSVLDAALHKVFLTSGLLAVLLVVAVLLMPRRSALSPSESAT
jgi:MFS family permease